MKPVSSEVGNHASTAVAGTPYGMGSATSVTSSALSQQSRTTTHNNIKVRHSYEHMADKVLKEGKRDSGVLKWSLWRTRLHHLFESAAHSAIMGIVICMNAILVIHQTDVKAEVGPDNIPDWIENCSTVFLTVYTIELIVRFYVYRMEFFASRWNIVDLVVVLVDFIAELASAWVGGAAPSVSILRIFRLVRLLRLISMLTYFHELQTMLLGFGSAMKAMVWASFMIGVVLTVCSIIAVEFIHPLNVEVAKTGVYDEMGCRRCARAFETVAESNLTFIQQIIAGDSWGKITIPIMEAYPGSGVFFLIVFGLIDLGVLNLILTVIVNAAESARETNHEIQLRHKRMQTEQMKNKLKSLCASLDNDCDGRLTLQEFMSGVDDNEEFRKALALLDIQRQDAEVIYHLMDEDKSGDVDFNEFVHTMISTKHESLNTKLLFLKASIHQLNSDLGALDTKMHEVVFGHLLESSDVKDAVVAALDEAPGKRSSVRRSSFLNPGDIGGSANTDRIMAECLAIERKLEQGFAGLQQNLEQRWQQAQHEQGKMLERVLDGALLTGRRSVSSIGASQDPGTARPATLSSISMPPLLSPVPSCTPCEIGYKNKSRIVYDLPADKRESLSLSVANRSITELTRSYPHATDAN